MKQSTRIVALMLPRLSDRAAAQLVELLHALLASAEHHYTPQIHRHRKRQAERQLRRAASEYTAPLDPPF